MEEDEAEQPRTETGATQPQAKECQRPPDAGRSEVQLRPPLSFRKEPALPAPPFFPHRARLRHLSCVSQPWDLAAWEGPKPSAQTPAPAAGDPAVTGSTFPDLPCSCRPGVLAGGISQPL